MPHHITFMTRVGCHLCDDARGVVSQVAAETGTPVEERDVDTDPGLRAEYGDWVPVVLIDGKQHGFFRIDEDRLRRALA
jgi:glutaredoxin